MKKNIVFVIVSILLLYTKVFSQAGDYSIHYRNGEFGFFKGSTAILPFEERAIVFICQQEKAKYGGPQDRTTLKAAEAPQHRIAVYDETVHFALFDLNGKQLTDFIYRFCFDTINNQESWGKVQSDLYNKKCTPIFIDDKMGLLNENGKIIVEPKYGKINYGFSKNKLAFYVDEGRIGIINSSGVEKIRLPKIYKISARNVGDDGCPYSNELLDNSKILAYLKDESDANKKNIFGLISIDINKFRIDTLLTPDYEDIGILNSHNCLVATKNNKKALFSFTGKKLSNFIYDNISDLESWSEDALLTRSDELTGLIGNNGNVFVQPAKISILHRNDTPNIFVLKNENKYAVYSLKMKKSTPFKYSHFKFIDNYNPGKKTKGKVIEKDIYIKFSAESNSELDKLGKIDENLVEHWGISESAYYWAH